MHTYVLAGSAGRDYMYLGTTCDCRCHAIIIRSSAIRHHKILHVRRTIDRFNAKENKMHSTSILGALLFVTVMALSVLGKDTHRNCGEYM